MRKKTLLTSLLIAFTSTVAASHGASGGLFSLLSNLPFPTDNWRQIGSAAAVFGMIWFTVYMILKKLIMRFGLEDLFNMSSTATGDSGRNLAAVMSLLVVVSMLGAMHNVMGVVFRIQQVLLLGLVFLVIILLIGILGGGFGGILAVGGYSGKAVGWGGNKASQGAKDLWGSDPVKAGRSKGDDFKNWAGNKWNNLTSSGALELSAKTTGKMAKKYGVTIKCPMCPVKSPGSTPGNIGPGVDKCPVCGTKY